MSCKAHRKKLIELCSKFQAKKTRLVLKPGKLFLREFPYGSWGILITDLSVTVWPKGFPGGSDGRESVYDAGDPGLIPGLGRSRNGNPLQYSCLENSMNRGAWRATVHGVTESDMTELND